MMAYKVTGGSLGARRDGVHFQKGKAALGQPPGFIRHDQRRAILMRQRLDALRQLHRIAIDAVAHAAIAAEAARDHRAGGDADADLHQRRRAVGCAAAPAPR